MKLSLFIFAFLFCTHGSKAQKPVVNEFTSIDVKALKIPDSLTRTTPGIANYITANFKTDEEKSRAIFIWIASNIQYDLENMFAINFYETKDEKINKPLRFRKGICENYAALFTDICLKTGIKSFVIEGYTKQNGFTDYIPHAWSAALIDSSWFMFDPTWGSGYVSSGKFVKKINNEFYKVAPQSLLKSHMPFDYLWQLLNYTVTNQEFYGGRITPDKTKPFFNYADSIKLYEQQNQMDQLISQAYRVEKNGVRNSLIFDRLQHLKLAIENDRQNRAISLYNGAVADYNEAINNLNIFIQYRNKQFTPLQGDSDIKKMVDNPSTSLKEARLKLDKIHNPDAATALLISQLNKSIEEMSVQVKEQGDWLAVYFGKGRVKRKAMFYETKRTWMGIPIN